MMLPIRAEFDLHPDQPVTSEQVTDIIELVGDFLADQHQLDPWISTTGFDPVHMVIELQLDTDPATAIDEADDLLREALRAGDVRVATRLERKTLALT